MAWKLKRLKQCEKCPWKKTVDPYDIPNGYSLERHQGLSATIADPNNLDLKERPVMACHEHDSEEEVHCIGWLYNQIGTGNNIGLRMKMLSCENGHHIKIEGEQHATFEETLPDTEKENHEATD